MDTSHDDLDRWLDAARAPEWQQRARAATALARFDDPRAATALARLLRDPDDTAVVESAALALAARRDGYAAELILRALGEADAQDDDDAILAYFLARDAELFDASGLYAAAQQALDDADETIRNGAAVLVDYVSGRPSNSTFDSTPRTSTP